jgi:hypothetical protein
MDQTAVSDGLHTCGRQVEPVTPAARGHHPCASLTVDLRKQLIAQNFEVFWLLTHKMFYD